jgi:type IV secretory pathway VirB10-like protein
MAEPSTTTSGTTPVTDHRTVPRGVLPRGTQTWLMAAIAVGVIGIILIAGRPDPPARPTAPVATTPQAPNPDRVRDYQDRLRIQEMRAAQEAQAATVLPPPAAPNAYENVGSTPPEDPIVAERKRREYESLFASNVVLSRRAENQRPDSGRTVRSDTGVTQGPTDPATPSIDEIADAAVRATARAGVTPPGMTIPTAFAPTSSNGANKDSPPLNKTVERAKRTERISATGPLHRVLEGTVIDTVLANRLDGSVTAPVNCLVTNAIYSHSRQHVLIPAGARVLGETKPVQTFGEARLAVVFHRLVMPDGSAYSLDAFLGTNQIGDAGLRDRVNQHYWSTFGAAGAVGLITGLAQYLGTAGLSRGSGDRTVIIAGGASDATAQASLQVMNRYLNRMPTITIREGHRVKVYLTSDLELPAYEGPAVANRF